MCNYEIVVNCSKLMISSFFLKYNEFIEFKR